MPTVDIEALIELVKNNPDLYAELLKYLSISLPRPTGSKPTELTIDITTTVVKAGDTIAVTGRLTSDGKTPSEGIRSAFSSKVSR
nr:MAG: hypothetical protein TU35_07730 [Thermoproteus sp. AZ2]